MVPEGLWAALGLASVAGLSVPLGALVARRGMFPRWLDEEARHTVVAFGGGALFAAVALVLVPEGAAELPPWAAVLAFLAGGGLFYLADKALARAGGHVSQFIAMLLDYLPEAMALGALITDRPEVAVLMAGLIMLQNLPEAFNAYREMDQPGQTRRTVFLLFVLAVPMGTVSALVGHVYLSDARGILGLILLFAAGGIVYLLFEDVAPQVPLEHSRRPPLGAVAGFALGLAGYLATL